MTKSKYQLSMRTTRLGKYSWGDYSLAAELRRYHGVKGQRELIYGERIGLLRVYFRRSSWHRFSVRMVGGLAGWATREAVESFYGYVDAGLGEFGDAVDRVSVLRRLTAVVRRPKRQGRLRSKATPRRP